MIFNKFFLKLMQNLHKKYNMNLGIFKLNKVKRILMNNSI